MHCKLINESKGDKMLYAKQFLWKDKGSIFNLVESPTYYSNGCYENDLLVLTNPITGEYIEVQKEFEGGYEQYNLPYSNNTNYIMGFDVFNKLFKEIKC